MYFDDLFYAVENADFWNFTGFTRPQASGYKLKEVIINVENACTISVDGFVTNSWHWMLKNVLFVISCKQYMPQ